MSQLNFYRLSILFFAVLTVATPPSYAAALQMRGSSPAAIKEEIYQSFKAACDKIQDEQSCQTYARGRDCSWTNGKCQCVPNEIMVESSLNSAVMLAIGALTALTGLALVSIRECGSDRCEPYKTISGAVLVAVSAAMLYGARVVKTDYEGLRR